MKAVVVERPGVVALVERPRPQLTTRDNVLVRVVAVGICGSDVHIYDGTNAAATYPRVMGHEVVGVVEAIGPGVRTIAPGDRITLNQVISCGECYPCRLGRPNVCYELRVRGVHIDGGQQEFLAVREEDCHRLPERLSDLDGVMVEPVTIALQGCARAELSAEDTLLLIGYGALGSSLLKVARLKTPRIIVADIVRARLDEAECAGATHTIDLTEHDLDGACRQLTDGHGVTVSIDAACTQDSLMQALRATGNAGRVVTMGFAVAPSEVNQFLITSKELDVRGSRLQNGRFPEALRLVEDGEVSLAGAVSHSFPLTEAQAALDLILSGDRSVRKVALTFADLG